MQYLNQKKNNLNRMLMTNEIFEEALDEMIRYSKHHTEHIIRYRNEIL